MRNDMFVDGQNVHTRSKWKTNYTKHILFSLPPLNPTDAFIAQKWKCIFYNLIYYNHVNTQKRHKHSTVENYFVRYVMKQDFFFSLYSVVTCNYSYEFVSI